MSSHVSDLAIRLKNGYMVGRSSIDVSFSKINKTVLDILKKSGYIADFKVVGDGGKKLIYTTLLYKDKTPALTDVKLVSKPGRRVYVKARSIPHVRGGLGIALLTTPAGIMTDADARKKNLGGEVLFYVW